MADLPLAVIVIVLSLIFTFTNGFQDGSSVAAGAIACRALSPARAVILVSSCEFFGSLIGGSAVAASIISMVNHPESPDLLLALTAGMFAAIVWNYLTKIMRFPSSSTHALAGGLLGGLLAAGGPEYISWGRLSLFHPSGMGKIFISLFLSPLLGFVFGFFLIKSTSFLLRRATRRISPLLKYGQCATVGLLAFAHGANDPQKAMAVILLALNSSGLYTGSSIPPLVRIGCGLAITVGVMMLAPGIVKRVGSGIYRLRVLHGFVMEAASGGIVLFSSLTGCPVATSQVVSSTVMGVGSGEHYKDVHWLVARDILMSWFLTIPCAGLCAYASYLILFHWFGVRAGL